MGAIHCASVTSAVEIKMNFQFVNVQEFLWMEGHGPYVWSAYLVTFAGLLGVAIKIRLEAKKFYKIQASLLDRSTV